MKENIVSFDYKNIKVKREMEAIVTDAYTALGWELINNSIAENSPYYINLSFKRGRKVENKMKLLTLESKLNETLVNIESIQEKKKNAGVIEGLSIGVVGTLMFGGGLSMSMTLTGIGFLAGGILLGVAGVAVAVIGWLVSKKIKKKKVTRLSPILESELDKLADICEQANELQKEE